MDFWKQPQVSMMHSDNGKEYALDKGVQILFLFEKEIRTCVIYEDISCADL